jgi:hypothetical protein
MPRLAATAAAGALALGVFAALEPRCLKGPMGLVDPAITALWINNVSELQGVLSLVRNLGADAFAIIAFPCLVIASAVLVTWRGLRTPLVWAPLAALAVSTVIAAGTIRMAMYVVMIGMPFVGAAVDALTSRTARPLLIGAGGAALASPPVFALVVMWLAGFVVEPMGKPAAAKTAPLWTVDVSRCLRPEIYRPVAAVPPGLIFGPLELGPSLLAFTPHSVVDAGYHRAYKSIIFEEEVMRGPASAARERLIERGVTYVMTCTDFPNYPNPAAFYNALLTDPAPAWLERVPLPEGNVLRMWRVRG